MRVLVVMLMSEIIPFMFLVIVMLMIGFMEDILLQVELCQEIRFLFMKMVGILGIILINLIYMQDIVIISPEQFMIIR